MSREPPQLAALCRSASSVVNEGRFDLEAAFAKARLEARVLGEPSRARVRLGRFEVLRWLGRGGIGTVFEARDLQQGARLALKVLQSATTDAWSADGLTRLQREFRFLADISHPNLVAMYELHVERALPFFTMALVSGSSLQALLGGKRALDEELLRSCLVQLLLALEEIHAHGTVHGDLKPSNVLLDAGGKLTLLDFGVARALHERHGSQSSGTLRYLAPERLREGRASPAWDYYALGLLSSELLEHARTHAPLSARADARVARLCAGLLAPDPQARFGAAELRGALQLSSHPVSLPARRAIPFVARERELAELQGARERVVDGPVICRVRGEPGIGKTALVQHALRGMDRTSTLVLEGKCHPREVLPYKGWDGVIEALAQQLALDPRVLGDLDARAAAALARVFPALRRAHGAPEHPLGGDPRAIRQHAFGALSSVLARLAEQRRVVIFLDDLQWGDADGAALLTHVLCGPSRPPLLLIASIRDQESGPSVRALEAASIACPSVDIELRGLNATDCGSLLAHLAPDAACTAQAERLRADSGGNPLLLTTLLNYGTDGTSAEPPKSFEAFVAEEHARLDPDARDLLSLSALAGGPVSLRLLGRALGAPDQVWQPLGALRNRRLLRSTQGDGDVRVLPHHDRVRESVLSLLPLEDRRSGHARLARAAILIGLDDPAFIAGHYEKADRREKAARYFEMAADRAHEAMAFAHAPELYARALACGAPRTPSLVRKLAEASAALGDVKTAAPLYREAAASSTREASIQLRLRAAEMYMLAGAQQQGLSLLRPALRELHIPFWMAPLGATALASLSFLGASLWRRVRPRSTPAPDARVETSFRVGYMLTMLTPPHGMALLLWSAARALRRGSALQRGRALAQLAHVRSTLGYGAEAGERAMLDEALALTRPDPNAHTHARLASALTHFSRTRYGAALAELDTASALIAAEPVDTLGFIAHVDALRASVCVQTGDLTRLDAFAEAAHQQALAYENHSAASQLRYACAFRALSRDDPGPMERYAREDRQRWNGRALTPLYGLAVFGECHRLLYVAQPAQAAELMAREARRFTRSGVGRIQPWSVALTYLWGCVALTNSARSGDAFARTAQRFAARLERHPACCAAGFAALLRAGLLRSGGERAKALECYAQAETALLRAGMRGHAASAAYRCAELLGEAEPSARAPWFEAQAVSRPILWAKVFAP